MTQRQGVLCPVCGVEVMARRVVCASCEAPHHEECFEYAGRCAIYACGGSSAGKPQTARTPDPRQPTPFAVEFTSWREGLSLAVFLIATLGAAIAGLEGDSHRRFASSHPIAFPVLSLVALAALVLWLGMNDYRLVDPAAGTIWRHYWFFGRRKLLREVTRERCTYVRLRADRLGVEPSDVPPQVQWQLRVGRKREDDICLGSWTLDEDRTVPDRVPEPLPEWLTFARNVAAAMGQELEILRKPRYTCIPPGEKFKHGA